MAIFNSREWHHLYVNENSNNSFIGTNLWNDNHNSGAVFFQDKNLTQGRQRWQIYPVDDTYYVLRTREGGADAFLAAMYSADEDTPGKTRARMVRGNTTTDDCVYWRLDPWNDGTFYLTNKQNGTKWHMGRKPTGLVAMDSNTTGKPNGQRWSWETVDTIKEDKWATVSLPGLTKTISSPSSPTGSSSSSSSTASPSSGGLSTAAKAGIGGAVGGVALIALVVLVLFLLRRRRRAHSSPTEMAFESKFQGPEHVPTLHYELNHSDTVKYEMQDTQFTELPQTPRPVELEGDAARRGFNGR